MLLLNFDKPLISVDADEVAVFDSVVEFLRQAVDHGDLHDDRAGDQHGVGVLHDQRRGHVVEAVKMIQAVLLHDGAALAAGEQQNLSGPSRQ